MKIACWVAESPVMSTHAAAAIAGEWASSQPMAAWTWVTSLPEDALTEAMSRVATRLAEINPTKALQAINSLTDSSERASRHATAGIALG